MCAKERHSHDQKRKAKLAARAKKHPVKEKLAYSGTKYQKDRWVPYVHRTELAVVETIELSKHHLTNAQAEAAFTQLIGRLRAGQPAALQAEEADVPFALDNLVEFLIWNIRRNWTLLFQESRPVPAADLVGILRTLLHSIEAHAWKTGPERGYVEYIYNFLT